MTYPGPPTRRRLLPYHSEAEMLELEARAGLHVGLLPAARGDALDGVTGAAATQEGGMRGWTAQQPWTHVDCPVMHVCIMCGRPVDPDYLREHADKGCRVARELEQ